MSAVRLYFDFISPYSYLALSQAEQFSHDNDVQWEMRPILYAAVLDVTGLIGPAEIEIKRTYSIADIVRCADDLGVPLVGPPVHPFISLAALRTTVVFLDRPELVPLCVSISTACWGQGRDITDLDLLRQIVAGVGLDAGDLEAEISDPAIKQKLKNLTSSAIETGVFGVPTFEYRNELFWGHDRMHQLSDRLAGEPGPDERVAEILARPRGADRARRPR